MRSRSHEALFRDTELYLFDEACVWKPEATEDAVVCMTKTKRERVANLNWLCLPMVSVGLLQEEEGMHTYRNYRDTSQKMCLVIQGGAK